jgi:hypothetical protein
MVHTIPNDKDLSILPSKPNLDQYQGIPITYSMVHLQEEEGLKIANKRLIVKKVELEMIQ